MIRLGLQIPSFTYPGVADDALFERVSDIAVTAEESGFDSIWVMDHFHQLPLLGPPTLNMMESYSLLAALAARTARVQLGTLVTGVTYRNPAVLAKEVTTLDVISRGRAILGIGAAWFDQEHEGYGVPFPSTGERMDRLEEAVQICRAMFTQETATFDGRYYRVKDAINNPRPIRPDGIPIMIGGGGEKRTLRIAALHADEWNVWGDPELCAQKAEVLARHCSDIGRDPSAIVHSTQALVFLSEDEEWLAGKRGQDIGRPVIVGNPDEVTEIVGRYREAGIDEVIVPEWNMGPMPRRKDTLDLFIERVAPSLR